MKAFNRALIQEFRANHGQLSGPMAGRSLMILTTTGARTGQPRTVVLGYGKRGDRYVVIASANAAPSDPAWYRNLQAHPIATVEVADSGERDQLAGAVPWLQSQQKLTSRRIPIVVLNRA
jgi:deazaflavin-dependent oxidoreductase (nitroreductase family)